MSSRTFISLAGLAVLLLLLASATLASATTADNCATVTADPLSGVDFANETFLACTAARCHATLGVTITSGASGYCDGNATAEVAVDCTTLAKAYSAFYACVQNNLRGTAVGGADYHSELEIYYSTPGVPYTLTNLPCYACNHFKTAVVAAGGSACSTLTCAECCAGQSPQATTPGSLGKGYNAVLCGNGCLTALLMIPFTMVSFLIFICCCCNWPSPALKSTAARVKAEEDEAERALRHPHGSDAEKDSKEEEEKKKKENSSGDEEKADEEEEEREPFKEVKEDKN